MFCQKVKNYYNLISKSNLVVSAYSCGPRQVTLENKLTDGMDKVQIVGCRRDCGLSRRGLPSSRHGAQPGLAASEAQDFREKAGGSACVCVFYMPDCP